MFVLSSPLSQMQVLRRNFHILMSQLLEQLSMAMIYDRSQQSMQENAQP